MPKHPHTKKITRSYESLRWIVVFLGLVFGSTVAVADAFFIYGDKNWKPRDLFIAFSILGGIEWGYYTFNFASFYRSSSEQLALELGTLDLGVYRRFCSYYILKTFEYVSKFIVWIIWLSIHEGKISSTETRGYLSGDKQTGVTPDCPTRSEDPFRSFKAFCSFSIVLYTITFTYGLVVVRDLFQSDSSLEEYQSIEVPTSKRSDDDEKGAGSDDERRKKENKKKKTKHSSNMDDYEVDPGISSISSRAKTNGSSYIYWIYTAANAFLYVFSFVYFAIFFVHSFENNADLTLSGMFVVFMIIVVAYLVKLFCYYIVDNPMRQFYANIKENRLGSSIDAMLRTEQMFWGFVVSVDFLNYAFYLAQSDRVTVFESVPRLDKASIQQTNAWEVFQFQTVIRGAQLMEWVIYLVLIIYTSKYIPFTKLEIEREKRNAEMIAATAPVNINITWIYSWTAVSWAAVLAMLVLNLGAVAGYAFLAIRYVRYAFAFIFLGLFMAIASFAINHYFSGVGLVIRSSSLYHSWSIYSIQVLCAVPLYYFLQIITLAIAWGKYNDLGHEVMRLLLKTPTTTPINAVTYQWWNIVLMSVFLLLPLVRLMSENNASLVLKRYIKSKSGKEQHK